jgi:Cu/Ag efflux protein CusF
MMDGKDMGQHGKDEQAQTHQADGVVKAIDTEKGKVTLAHGPVKSLNWPAMTMAFAVKDKSLLDQVKVGQKVHVEFVKRGSDYIVASIK